MAWIAAHLKHFLTVAFVCSIVPLILKIVDKKLSREKKERFNKWLDGLIPQVNSWRPDDLYLWVKGRTEAYLIPATFILCALLLLVVLTPRHMPHIRNQYMYLIIHWLFYDDQSWFAAVVLGAVGLLTLFLTLARFCKAASLSVAIKRGRKTFLKLIISTSLGGLAVVLVSHYVFGNGEPIRPSDLPVLLLALGGFSLYLTTVCLGLPIFVVFATIRLLAYPIKLLSHCLWWLATDPRGAWVAMIAAITTGFELLRLIFT